MKAGLCALALFAAATSAAEAACDPGEQVARFSHVRNAETDLTGRAAARLAAQLNATLDGTLCVEVFPEARLMSDAAVLDALRDGALAMAAPALDIVAAADPRFELFDLPFLFASRAAVSAFAAGPAGQTLKDGLRAQGAQGLALWPDAMWQLSATVPLRVPGDAAGLTFRTRAALGPAMAALDAASRRMAWPEVAAAFDQEIVDGQEATWPRIAASGLHPRQDGVTQTDHGVSARLVVASAAWLDGLAPPVRAQVLEAVGEVSAWREAQGRAEAAAARQAIIDAGGVVRRLTPAQRSAWVAAMRPVWDAAAARVGAAAIAAAQAVGAPR
jgi:C4-dicarboxylate-binding protein DctP